MTTSQAWIILALIVIDHALIVLLVVLLKLRIRWLERALEEAEQPREIMQAVINETSVTIWDGEV